MMVQPCHISYTGHYICQTMLRDLSFINTNRFDNIHLLAIINFSQYIMDVVGFACVDH
jgi:hypothetical protein